MGESTFKLKSAVVEEVGAWITCKRCLGFGWVSEQIANGITATISDKTCPTCQGDGGEWHLDVKTSEWFDGTYAEINGLEIIKSSTLTREWAVCSKCEGRKRVWTYDRVELDPHHNYIPCLHCHKDEQGNPTGCEPGTQGEWEVKE